MNKQIIMKITFILLLLSYLLFNCSIVNATGGSNTLKQAEEQLNSWQRIGQSGQGDVNMDDVVNPIVDITQILITLGAGVLVAVTTYMGIRYLISSPEEQAKLKTQLIGLVVSGVVIFGAYYIWKIILQLASEF